WNEASVDGGEGDISAPFDVGNHDRRNHDNQEVDAPVDNVRCHGALGANPKGIDLSGIQPRHGEASGAEEGNIQAQSKRTAVGGSRGSRDETTECDDHRNLLAKAAMRKNLRRLSDSTVQNDTREKTALTIILTPPSNSDVSLLSLSDFSNRMDDGIAASNLLENLRRHSKHDTSEMLRWSSGKKILELEIEVDSVLDLDGVDNSADVNRGLATVNALAIEGGHDYGGIHRTILLAKPK
ncbi:MAG: hypothetical protein Q9175_001077, partial [Cornicularia normoerica]